MTHRFLAETASPLAGKLTYSGIDRGFAFHPHSSEDLADRVGTEGCTSLVADTLQLEVAVETCRALYVWGYLPKDTWAQASLELPSSRGGKVTVEVDDPPLEEAISVSIARVNWEVVFDASAGLVRVVRDPLRQEELIEIADGVHLGLSGTDLNSFWLEPEFIE